MSLTNIPNEWFCPITSEIMKDPVIGPDGHTYERTAIEQWLSQNTTSPITREVMALSMLIPNIALRNTIEQFMTLETNVLAINHHIADAAQIIDDELQCNIYGTNILGSSYLNIRLIPPENPIKGIRKPVVFICILDISWSMGQSVQLNSGSTVESHGFSRLDLVKHSMNTIINTLSDDDYLAIVPFSTSANVLLGLTKMNLLGKENAKNTIARLKPDGSTNIWDGLRVGINLARDDICADRNVVTLLLTDGEPNINPPRGIIETLKKYLHGFSNRFTLNTFGFGYQLDSELLNNISEIGNGSYAFIPDCTMVGTVFINYISSIMASYANMVTIDIDGAQISTAAIQYGQPFNIALKSFAFKEIKITYMCNGEIKQLLKTLDDVVVDDIEVLRQYAISYLVQILSESHTQSVADVHTKVMGCYDQFQSLNSNNLLDDLLEDIYSTDENSGQIEKAFSKDDWYNKWGKHFILSFVRAHILQQCNNFKDKSVQAYQGELFKNIQKFAEDIFCKLPPPVPVSVPEQRQPTGQINGIHNTLYNQTPSYTPISSMSSYINVSGGCFLGIGQVKMFDGTHKFVDGVKKGDHVYLEDKLYATVVCVVKTKIVEKSIDLIHLTENLYITPYHPIYVGGQWRYPLEIDKKINKSYTIDYVYDFVLDKGHYVFINGIKVVTLGHDFKELKVAHPYFGSKKVIEDLQKKQGYSSGQVEILNTDFIRKDDLICCLK